MYVSNKSNVVGLERPHGHSVMGDKAGRRKLRSFHGKLPLEGARDHHTQMVKYLLGICYHLYNSSDRFKFQVSGMEELE